MHINREDIDAVNSTIKISITPEDYQEKVEKELKEQRRKASIPGFRPGKVPMSIIKKKMGTYFLGVEMEKTLNESLHKYISENNLQLLGEPLEKENGKVVLDVDELKTYDFTFEIGLAPQFDVHISSKEKFNYYVINIDEKLINDEIDALKKRHGKIEPADISKEEDIFEGEIIELDKKGEKAENGITSSIAFLIQNVEDEKVKKTLIGLKKGSTVLIHPHKITKNHSKLAELMGVEIELAEKINTEWQFTVNDIKTIIPANLDQNLFDTVFGKNKIKNEEEFKNLIKEELTKHYSIESDWKLRFDIKEKLMEKFSISTPDNFLKKWILRTSDGKITDKDIEEEYDAFAKTLKWQLIEDKIIKENNITVTKEESLEVSKEAVRAFLAKYGISLHNEEKINELAENSLSDNKRAQEIHNNLYQDKLLEFYKKTFTLKTKNVSLDGFILLLNESKKKSRFNLNFLKKYVR